MTRNRHHSVAILLLIVNLLLGCSEKKSINCESIDQDVTVYFGRKFENEKVVVWVDGRIVFEDVVSTDRSTEVAANTTIKEKSVRWIAIVLGDSDSINVLRATFELGRLPLPDEDAGNFDFRFHRQLTFLMGITGYFSLGVAILWSIILLVKREPVTRIAIVGLIMSVLSYLYILYLDPLSAFTWFMD